MGAEIKCFNFVYIFLGVCFFPVGSDRRFFVTLNAMAQNMCATDTPSLNISTQSSSVSTCVPSCILCGWTCSNTPQCTNYNFKSVDQCELFFFEPREFALVDGCKHFHFEENTSEVTNLGQYFRFNFL